MGTVVVSDEHIKGRVHVGASVEVKHPDKGQFFEGVVAKIFDTSQYTVGKLTFCFHFLFIYGSRYIFIALVIREVSWIIMPYNVIVVTICVYHLVTFSSKC